MYPTTLSQLAKIIAYHTLYPKYSFRYIGETSRHFSTRIKEHTESDKNSHIFKHFNTSPLCKNKYSSSCFSILDSASSSIDLKLKEAFDINKIKPELNKQLQHYNTFLTF